MFPDLRVEVVSNEAALKSAGLAPPEGAPLLRYEVVTDGVLMAFMNCVPGSDQFSSLVFTQPSHQQRFAVGRGLDSSELKVDIRRQYTVDQQTRETDQRRHEALTQIKSNPGALNSIFIWGSQTNQGLSDFRILRLPAFADIQLEALQRMMRSQQGTGTAYFDDNAPTSALFAMQLNDPVYNLTINMTSPSKASQAIASLASPDMPSGEPELRTVRMLQAVRVKKLSNTTAEVSTAPQNDSDDSDNTDISTPEEGVFTRATYYKPILESLSSNLAPNIRAMPLHHGPDVADQHMLPGNLRRNEISPRAKVERPTGSEPASSPRFLMRVSSNLVGSHNQVILERTNIPQDLIFSIVLKQSEINQYLLMEVTVDIELGAPDAPTYCLMSNYTGPGTHMLTNLRFNVIPTTFHDQNQNRYYLRIRLLPRAEKGWVMATAVSELSFLLGLASMNALAEVQPPRQFYHGRDTVETLLFHWRTLMLWWLRMLLSQ